MRRLKPIRVLILVVFLCVSTIIIANASTMIFEAGPFAIIMDKDMEITGDVLGPKTWTMLGFEQITSRDSIKANYYNLLLKSSLVQHESGYVYDGEISIEICEKPLESHSQFTILIPLAPVKEITVGKINPVKTTLYSGILPSGAQAHLVNYTSDGIYCKVYAPFSLEYEMTKFFEGFSVIRKADLGKYNLSDLWSE